MTIKEYIERETLLQALEEIGGCGAPPESWADGWDKAISQAIKLTEEQPAAVVVEVRHGKWQPCFEDWRKQIEGDECSACGFQHYGTNISDYPFCPNCGAKMDGKVGDDK